MSVEAPTVSGPAGVRRTPTAPAQRASLHLFCEDAATAEAAGRALADRRLATLQAASHPGGIRAALAAYVMVSTPDLVVLELSGDAAAMLADLEKLAEVCDAGTKVIVIGRVNDVLLFRELIRRDISDYLVAPLEAAQLADSIAGVLAGGAASAPGRVVAFIGAKGGCGSSTVCHNTAWVLAEWMAADTVIADFDLAFGTLGLDFNQDGARGLGDALAAGERLDAAMLAKLISKCSDRLGLLTPPCTLDAEAGIAPEPSLRLVRLMSQTTAFTMLDLPRDWRDVSRMALMSADDIVITAEPDLANLRNAKNVIEASRATRADGKAPILVLNKTGLPRRPEITLRDFANAVDLEPAAVIGFDAQLFGTAANNGLMIAEVSAKARALDAYRRLAQIVGGASATRPANGLIKPLMARLSRQLAL